MGFQRFIDRKDKAAIIKSCDDFRFRRHGLPPKWVFYCMIIAVLVVIIMINFMSMNLILQPDDAPSPTNALLGFLFAIAILLTGVAITAYIIIYRVTATVLHTEFQNLLFAGGMGMHTEYCLIAHPKHGVVYYDYNFDKFYDTGDTTLDPLERLLGADGISDDARKKLEQAIASGKPADIPVSYPAHSNKKGAFTLKIEPLERPKGFVLLRAYA